MCRWCNCMIDHDLKYNCHYDNWILTKKREGEREDRSIDNCSFMVEDSSLVLLFLSLWLTPPPSEMITKFHWVERTIWLIIELGIYVSTYGRERGRGKEERKKREVRAKSTCPYECIHIHSSILSSVVQRYRFLFLRGQLFRVSHFVRSLGKESDRLLVCLFYTGFNAHQCLFKTFGILVQSSWITYSEFV